jgi:DNA-binding NtrC family response regulator
LLISDVVLANGENGIDVSEQFMARFPDAQRLLMSGYSNDLLSQRGKLVKDCIDITKPFEFEHFISVVNSAIAKL